MSKNQKIIALFFRFRFEMLGLLLIFILFGAAIIPQDIFEHLVMPSCFTLLGINAIILVKNRKKTVRFVFGGFAFIVLCFLLERVLNHQHGDLQILPFSVFVIFFAALTLEVFRQMIREKKINHSIIIAAFDCYLLLGLMGAMLFTLIIAFDPNAFINIPPGAYVFDKMLYFSFITVTSIGYGDISPVSQLAEKCTALFGLIAHFYSVVIVGIIVGKYVSLRGMKN